jgi:hypothetical protein
MATQASAITFLSTPGKPTMTEWALCNSILITHSDGCHLRYFIPLYHKYKVYTAYEYLEKFDLKRVRLRLFCFCFKEDLELD